MDKKAQIIKKINDLFIFDSFKQYWRKFKNKNQLLIPHMNNLQTKTLKHPLTQKLNKIQNFRIDKNIILRLHLIKKRTKIVFDGRLLYSNGLELTLSSNYWKLITDYHQIQTDSIIYLYDFESNTVNIRSYLHFFTNCQPKKQDVQIIATLIKKDSVCFVDKLYQYGILSLKGKYFFKRIYDDNLFQNKIIASFNSSHLKKQKPPICQAQLQSIVVNQKQLQLTSPYIHICPIQPVKSQVRFSELPQDLQYGPKNIKYHFNNGPELNKTKGGFFSLQKLFCSKSIKKLQKNQKLDFINQNLPDKVSNIQLQNQKTYVQRDILVMKSLNPERQQSKINRKKILKELVIVRQIKNSNHLINYYLNEQVKNSKTIFNAININGPGSEIETNSSISTNSCSMKDQKLEETFEALEAENVLMDFHPHTLQDYISFGHNHFDSKIKICLQMIESIIEIHKSHVIHRDLKPENALIDFTSEKFNPTLKLIDFSESAIFISQTKKFQNPSISKNIIKEIFDIHSSRFYAATIPYSPPQCQLNRQSRTSKGVNSFEIDYWSMGMILFEIFMGKKLLNYSKPYEEDVLNVIKEVGFENYFLKDQRRGFRIIENTIQLIAIKNIVCDQSKRMNATTCHNIISSIDQKFKQWTIDFNKKEQYTKMPLVKC